MTLGKLTGSYLVAHQAHGVGVRTDEYDIVVGAGFGKFRTFREESVAGMYGVGACVQSCVDYLLNIEISIFQCAVSQRTGLVGQTAVQSVGVIVGIDGYRADTQFFERTYHPYRNLSAACNQHFMYLS